MDPPETKNRNLHGLLAHMTTRNRSRPSERLVRSSRSPAPSVQGHQLFPLVQYHHLLPLEKEEEEEEEGEEQEQEQEEI